MAPLFAPAEPLVPSIVENSTGFTLVRFVRTDPTSKVDLKGYKLDETVRRSTKSWGDHLERQYEWVWV